MKGKNLSRATIETYGHVISFFYEQGYSMTTAELCRWKEGRGTAESRGRNCNAEDSHA